MNSNHSPSQLYLSPVQLAERVSFHPESIRNMIRQGRLPAVRIGNRLRVPLAEAEKFEQSVPVLPRKAS